MIQTLLAAGATVSAYDPVATEEAKKLIGPLAGLSYADNPMAACDSADALLIVTEWKEFRSPDFDDIRQHLKTPVIFDGRNLYSPSVMRDAGFEYFSIGRPALALD